MLIEKCKLFFLMLLRRVWVVVPFEKEQMFVASKFPFVSTLLVLHFKGDASRDVRECYRGVFIALPQTEGLC